LAPGPDDVDAPPPPAIDIINDENELSVPEAAL
jgi:hypothetical protein